MDSLPSLLSLIDYKVESVLWVGLSIGLYALGADVAWHYRRPRSGRLGHWAEAIKEWPYRHWLLEAVRFLYYIGIPYAALLRGIVLPRLMGLTHLDWVKGIGLGAALGGGTFLLLAVIWWWYVRAIAALPLSARERRGGSLGDDSTNGWILLREAIYLETHWAFYRSATILLLDDYYVGAFLSFLLVSLEWLINPAWRKDLSLPWRSADVLMRWSMAFATAIIFLFIRNLWLLVPIHWGIEIACRRLLAGFSLRLGVSPQNVTANLRD
ncbi:MAG: hypothetical protein ACE5I2_00045 [Anaerolineae bacterium]